MSEMRSREYWKSFVGELSAEEQERLLDILIEQRCGKVYKRKKQESPGSKLWSLTCNGVRWVDIGDRSLRYPGLYEAKVKLGRSSGVSFSTNPVQTPKDVSAGLKSAAACIYKAARWMEQLPAMAEMKREVSQ